ncbi:MAG: glycosyl transferase, partial [Verrucomicrobia bacterium]
GHAEKNKLLGGASALLFPIDWPEPFGLVMIEALACGTPVIGFLRGSVPEIIVEGETGFIVEDIDRAAEAVAKIDQISRARCRHEFELRFTDRRMAQDYVRIYQQLLSRSSTQAAA